MRLLYILSDAVVALVLAVMIFVSLLYQPTWAWVIAPIVIGATFIGTFIFQEADRIIKLAIYLAPLSLIIFLVFLAFSTENTSWGVLLAAAAYYAAGVALLSLHRFLVARIRGSNLRSSS